MRKRSLDYERILHNRAIDIILGYNMKKVIFVAIALGLSLLFLTEVNAQNADVNDDGVVNIFDLVLVGSHFGERVDAAQMSNIDVNSDGIVDVRDLVIVANIMQQGDITPTGGTLIFGRGGDSLTLDPIQVLDGESAKVCDMLYDTLIQYREDTTHIEPALAEAWTSSADGLVWTFHLRQGVQFHDGTPLNADAVVFSLTRPEAVFRDFQAEFISQITALDPFTVQIVLKMPFAPFISTVAGTAFSIVSPMAVRHFGESFTRKLCLKQTIHTGPEDLHLISLSFVLFLTTRCGLWNFSRAAFMRWNFRIRTKSPSSGVMHSSSFSCNRA